MSVYHFGPFEVRTHTGELYKFGTKIRLRGQPFEILKALLRRPGEVVTREEMRDQLWPSDTFVDFEHGINASLRKLRLALGDSALKPLYIETLPGIGYRFIAPLDLVEEAAQVCAPNDVPIPTTNANGGLSESERPEAGPRPFWFRRVLLGFAVVVVGGLLTFAGLRNWSVVHESIAKPPDGPPVSMSAGRDVDAQPHDSAVTASDGSNILPRVTAALSPIRGKVWVVSVAQASHVAFPRPSATPDATFITRGIAYLGSAPKNCYTLVSFLTECGIPGFELKFSGLANSNLGGAAAGPGTAMSGNTWGILIEFSGTANLTHGQDLSILHDDGVALKIDEKIILGFDGGLTTPVMESAVFTGPSGVHSFDLLYANATGGGAWLFYYPALF
jgi:DNA-binding winged helix-turn-helix (wHTH) protein